MRFRNEWLLFVFLSIIFLSIGVLLIPLVTNIDFLRYQYLFFGAEIVIYICCYLLKMIKYYPQKHANLRLLLTIEIIIVFILAIEMIMRYFNIFLINNSFISLGILLWIRGINGIIRGHYLLVYQKIEMIFNLFLITFGSLIFGRLLLIMIV